MFLKFLISSIFVSSVFSADWNYLDLGPDYWHVNYADCSASSQSPIDLEEATANYDSKLSDFTFTNYNTSLTWSVKNNGHSISAETTNTSAPYVEGSDFTEKYTLLNFHFHWGYNIYQGSEHLLNGKKFPLEVHLVHKSASDKIAVLGFFFEISESDNQNLDSVISVANLAESDGTKTIQFALSSMIPDSSTLNSNGYLRYSGSFTTPPCTEGVVWTVFKKKISISKTQVEKFYASGIKINFRDPQSLNGRLVTTNINSGNSGMAPRPIILLEILTILVLAIYN